MSADDTSQQFRACPAHLTRSWLLARLAGHLEVARAHIGALLALEDDDLIAAVAGGQRNAIERERSHLDVSTLVAAARTHGLELMCACDPRYPPRLRALDAPPAVLHTAGGLKRFLDLCSGEPVALVGSRRASEYGLAVARSLARDLAGAGVTVVSGLARGIDGAAHHGAIEARATVAVLPGPADHPYPAGQRGLYRAIVAGGGVAVSELPCGTGVRRWCFIARNRIIAGLAAMTVVVEAGARSGALPAAQMAREIGREVGAVPGRVTSAQAVGPHALLAEGATLVRDAQDVLDKLYGVGSRTARLGGQDRRGSLSPEQASLLAALGDGDSASAGLRRAGIPAERGLAVLSELELAGRIARGAGGSVIVIP